MANKFGKFLLFSAAAGAIAAGTYYFLQNKDKFLNKDTTDDADDDYDDFSEDLDDEPERSYVPLNADVAEEVTVTSEPEAVVENTSETAEVTDAAETAETAEAVEEFFDEEDEEQ